MTYTMLPITLKYITLQMILLYSSKSLKGINKKIKFDLKNIVHLPKANKISLNTGKTEIILFRTKKIKIKKHEF